MAVDSKVGGYWASLKLISDENSFKKGIGSLKEVSKSIGTVVKWAAGLAVVKNVFSGWMALMQRDELILAQTTNLASTELSAWSMAVGAAGVSAGQFTGALASLDSRLQRMKLGEVDVGLARSLGMLGIGFTRFAGEDAAARTKEVLKQAMAMQDQRKAAQLVADVLGSAGQEYFWYLKVSGESLDKQLAEGRALTFTNEKTKRDAMIFSGELRKTGGAVKEIGALWGSEFARELTPMIRGINSLIVANKGLIRSEVIRFAHDAGVITRDLVGLIERFVPRVVSLVDKLGGLEGIVHKVALGFAAWKIAQIGVGVFNLIKGVGGLAGAFRALGTGVGPALIAFAALYLIIDDLTARKSVLKTLFEMFVNMLPPGVRDDFAGLWKSLKDSLPSIADAFNQIVGFVLQLTGSTLLAFLQGTADFLTSIDAVLRQISGEDIVKAWSDTSIAGVVAGAHEQVKKGSQFEQGVAGATIENPVFLFVESLASKLIDRLGIPNPLDQFNTPGVELTVVDKTKGGVAATAKPTNGAASAEAARRIQAGTGVLP